MSSRKKHLETGLRGFSGLLNKPLFMSCILSLTFIFLLSISSFAQTNESPLQIWSVGNRRWNIEEEKKYAKWVEENITEDFFIRHKIPIDCADLPYAVRWIYSRISLLPAAATTKDHRLVGHWSKEWSYLPTHREWQKDLRFRKALLYILSETTTRTLPLDTYPIRIDKESVTPGTPFFITESHSGIIARVILDGSSIHPLQTWESTYPAKIRKLNQRIFIAPRPESTINSGIVKFRWPILYNGTWKYLPSKDHPYYSEEQYRSSFYEGYVDYIDAVAKRIAPSNFDPNERVERLISNISSYLKERIPIVLEGHKRCKVKRCPEGSELWEIYSTPGRDGFIIIMMDHLNQFIKSNNLDEIKVREKMESILLPISEDKSVSFYYIYQNYLWLSSHPEDSIEERWGLRKCDMIIKQINDTKKSISFIEKTYRKRDPKYADFSRHQQEEILKRLREEWEKSKCKGDLKF